MTVRVHLNDREGDALTKLEYASVALSDNELKVFHNQKWIVLGRRVVQPDGKWFWQMENANKATGTRFFGISIRAGMTR